MRGTILNTAAAAGGGVLGLVCGQFLPPEAKSAALHGLGLVTAGIGVKMFLDSRNALVAAGCVAIGGVLGMVLHLQPGIDGLAAWTQGLVGGQSQFAAGMVAAFVLFCVGPLTILGCLQDGIEGEHPLLSLKSVMDAISSFFLAAATGAGVFAAVVLLLLFQGGLTLGAKRLTKLAENKDALAETTACGGAILLATGIGLMEIKDLHPFIYLPAVVLAPLVVIAMQKAKVRQEFL